MKKTITIALVFVAMLSQSFAQDLDSAYSGSVKTPERNKDRLLISTYNCFWQGLPDGVTQRTISQGYNISLMFDMPTSEKSKISFGLGLGYSRNNLYSNGLYNRSLTDNTINMTPINVKYNTNKLAFSYVNIPLEIRFRSSNNIRVAVGLRSSLKVDAFSKFYGHNPDTLVFGQYDQLKVINHDISNTEKYLFEITARAGWKFINVNGSFMLNSLFNDKGPAISGYTLGLTLSLW
jgi:hypothetical protein